MNNYADVIFFGKNKEYLKAVHLQNKEIEDWVKNFRSIHANQPDGQDSQPVGTSIGATSEQMVAEMISSYKSFQETGVPQIYDRAVFSVMFTGYKGEAYSAELAKTNWDTVETLLNTKAGVVLSTAKGGKAFIQAVPDDLATIIELTLGARYQDAVTGLKERGYTVEKAGLLNLIEDDERVAFVELGSRHESNKIQSGKRVAASTPSIEALADVSVHVRNSNASVSEVASVASAWDAITKELKGASFYATDTLEK